MVRLPNAKREASREIAGLLVKLREAGLEDLSKIKASVCKKHGLREVVKNADVLEALPRNAPCKIRELLKTRRVRSLSGVSVVAVMAKPAWCPHGTCIYCPGGPAAGSPKSYSGFEPAARRAKQNDFDSFKQVKARLAQLSAIGHEPQKCEVIIMGGTFNAQPIEYQNEFVKGMYDAFNCSKSKSVFEAREKNQKAPYRVVGLTFETRPDWCAPKQIDAMLEYGATRVELGMQTLDDGVLKKANRRHTLRDSEDATGFAKDAFLKVCYHMMPGLFSTPEKDVAMFKKLFSSQKWRPDMLKIYPCLVLPGTGLHELWTRGEFTPYDAEEAAEVIAEAKSFIPEYCRVMRVDRDIPTNLIAAGVRKSNLRELVKRKLEERGLECRCIRCREAGLRSREGARVDWSNVEMKRLDYKASKGDEVFLSLESNDLLLGILRLRLPCKPWRPEITDAAGVRELHVYGEQLPLHSRKDAVQHKSLGKRLLAEAERIARDEWGCKKLLVTSGVGVREYYSRLGYGRDGVYVGKAL